MSKSWIFCWAPFGTGDGWTSDGESRLSSVGAPGGLVCAAAIPVAATMPATTSARTQDARFRWIGTAGAALTNEGLASRSLGSSGPEVAFAGRSINRVSIQAIGTAVHTRATGQ